MTLGLANGGGKERGGVGLVGVIGRGQEESGRESRARLKDRVIDSNVPLISRGPMVEEGSLPRIAYSTAGDPCGLEKASRKFK